MASSGDGGSSILRTRSAARSSQASSGAVRGSIAARRKSRQHGSQGLVHAWATTVPRRTRGTRRTVNKRTRYSPLFGFSNLK